MNIKFNVTRKFKINGKEYGSIEEVPDNLRAAVEKAMGHGAQTGATTKTKIVFNGHEYDSIDAMPTDARQLYEQVLHSAESGAAPQISLQAGITIGAQKNEAQNTRSGASPRPIKMESAFSPKALLFVLLIGLLAIGAILYFSR
jgi:hypothetical protein